MTERTVSEVVADLRADANMISGYGSVSPISWQTGTANVMDEAAALLERLAADARAAHDLLPDCDKCGGTKVVPYGEDDHPPRLHHGKTCPDCTDGKVSIEQLVALWRAVQSTDVAPHGIVQASAAVAWCAGYNTCSTTSGR